MIDHNALVTAMMCYSEQQFIRALRKDPERRSMQDLQVIHTHLAGMDALSKLRESALQSLCRMVRYERHAANDILYCRGEMASCWYILLSGAVFIDGSMFLARASFGKRIGGAARRHNECLILEPSEMIVIDYVDGRARTERITDSSSSSAATARGGHHDPNRDGASSVSSDCISEVTIKHRIGLHQQDILESQEMGSFVDSSDGGASTNSPPPPPHPPPRHPQIYHHHHHHHGHRGHHGHHHHHHHHMQHSSSGSGGQDSGQGSGHSSHSQTYGGSKSNQKRLHMRNSHSSDSSSAYSGSDTMQSSVPSSVDVEEVDLSGLLESVVDSDEEEGEESSLIVRDTVRECLEKDPSDRTEEDVDVLLEFTQHLTAFTNMTLSVRRALVATMVFAVVEKAGTVVMTDGEELDSWSVIINGHVEISHGNGSRLQELHLGDSFGITPTMDKLYHRGVMRTKCDDCQFVCVTQTDYYRILHQGEENQRRHEEDGRGVVLVTELRVIESGNNQSTNSGTSPNVGQRKGHVVIRGATDKLMEQLMDDNSSTDPTYIEDFLLTYRTFLDSPIVIANQLLEWFKDPQLRDKVTRVLLLWVNNHFTDFEADPAMIDFLETFETCLEAEKMQGQLRMLNFACAAKARKRIVTLTRPSRDEPLEFSIVGGYEKGCGIFISRIDKGSKADGIGLKRGDQILEVNGQSFEHGTKHARALEILKGVCHLSITVKSNLLAFKEMLHSSEDTPRSRGRGERQNNVNGRSSSATSISLASQFPSGTSLVPDAFGSALQSAGSETTLSATTLSPSPSGVPSRDITPKGGKRDSNISGQGANASGSGGTSRSRINRAFNRFLHKPKSLMSVDTLDDAGTGQTASVAASAALYNNSMSNPDLLRDSSASQHLQQYDNEKPSSTSEYPEHVLKVYKADQTFKYLLVHKETTAHEVVMLSLQEFGITESSSNFSLCEVSVSDGGFVKQRTLPDPLQNLAERIGLASRYYIKNKNSSETLLPDDAVNDLTKESLVNLLQLNPVEVSTQLMVEDFTTFRQIEATEYVDDLFELKSGYGCPNLSLFGELVNREMMWTISEIVSESNLAKRMRIIKQFIKISRQCKETQNFNSMFAIISGLGHAAVSRLKLSWEKLPSKYQKLFADMQQLMDPSRNMSRYRNLVNGDDVQPPVIPFYPVVKKDLTFIHLANDRVIDGLVNFEKLRMIAKEVRSLTNMCSAPLDLFSMLELGGQQPSTAMVAMNQLTTGGQHLKATVNRRRKKPSGVPNPKRMFEEAQMVRRVKSYLKNMKIVTDYKMKDYEEKLHQMSIECEAPVGGIPQSIHSLGQHSLRKRNPSPTPSAVSSTSSASHHSNNIHNQNNNTTNPSINSDSAKKGLNTSGNSLGVNTSFTNQSAVLNSLSPSHPKFGAASPHAVKKLLALSEQGKTRPKPSSTSNVNASSLQQANVATSSPMVDRKGNNRGSSANHHSNTSQVAGAQSSSMGDRSNTVTMPVDLTAESSSVSSLSRKIPNTGSVTSTDSGLGFYDHRLNPSGQRVHGHLHHSQQVKTQHGKSISGKLISVTGNSNSGTKGNDMSYQLSSSASIKEQRKHQQVLLQQQRQRGKSHSSSALLSGQGGGNVISSSSQGNNNSSMVSLHHAVPIEIRSPSSTSSAASSIKSVSTSNKNGKILINTRSNISLSNAISSGQSNLSKNVPAYFVTDPDDEDDETQVSAV